MANVDIRTPEVTAQQQVKSAITAMAQATIQPCASDPGRTKPIISGPLEYPGIEAHKEVLIEVLVVNRHFPSRGRQQKQSPNHTRRCRRSPTPKPHQVSCLTADRPPNPQDKLPTDVASDGQTSFHTTLQMITKQHTKPLLVKVDPGADVNTVPLSKYKKLFPTHFTKADNLKQKILHPTTHTWRAHDETPQKFLGFFITDIRHKTTADVLLVRFYVFKDTTSPKILFVICCI